MNTKSVTAIGCICIISLALVGAGCAAKQHDPTGKWRLASKAQHLETEDQYGFDLNEDQSLTLYGLVWSTLGDGESRTIVQKEGDLHGKWAVVDDSLILMFQPHQREEWSAMILEIQALSTDFMLLDDQQEDSSVMEGVYLRKED